MDSGDRVLVVTIDDVLYPITEQVLHQIFDSYGDIEILDLFSMQNGDIQALIWFRSTWSAAWAMNSLQGRSIYTGCCHLGIEFYLEKASMEESTEMDLKFENQVVIVEDDSDEVSDNKASDVVEKVKHMGQPPHIRNSGDVTDGSLEENEGDLIVGDADMVSDQKPKRTDEQSWEQQTSKKEELQQEEEMKRGRTEATTQFPAITVVSSPNALQIHALQQPPFPIEPSSQCPDIFEDFTAWKLIEKHVVITNNSDDHKVLASIPHPIKCCHNEFFPEFSYHAPNPCCFPMVLPPPRPPSQPPDTFPVHENPFTPSPHSQELGATLSLAVPTDALTEVYEALELRGKWCDFKRVFRAVENGNIYVGPVLFGMEWGWCKQKLGANAMLEVFLEVYKESASVQIMGDDDGMIAKYCKAEIEEAEMKEGGVADCIPDKKMGEVQQCLRMGVQQVEKEEQKEDVNVDYSHCFDLESSIIKQDSRDWNEGLKHLEVKQLKLINIDVEDPFYGLVQLNGKMQLLIAIGLDVYKVEVKMLLVAECEHVEVPVPVPGKDEVLLKLEATSLNPVDWKIQKGMLRLIFLPSKFPHIPGTDVAGEVVEVGPGVKNFKAGEKVIAMLSHASGGGLAEYAVAKESLTVARPPEVSAAEGSGLPVAGLTAHRALIKPAGIKLDGSGPQKNILITAASGGVGQYAVQLAKLGNTHVTATCGARNIDLVKSLGADEVLDYKTQGGATLTSPSGKKYDAVIHCATDIPWSTFEPNLGANGIVVDITPGPSTFLTFALKKLTFSKIQLVPLLLIPKRENLNYLVKLVKEGKLKTVIDSEHPLSKAEEAWAKSMDGHATGKVIVKQ